MRVWTEEEEEKEEVEQAEKDVVIQLFLEHPNLQAHHRHVPMLVRMQVILHMHSDALKTSNVTCLQFWNCFRVLLLHTSPHTCP